jgi:hypothetical protein
VAIHEVALPAEVVTRKTLEKIVPTELLREWLICPPALHTKNPSSGAVTPKVLMFLRVDVKVVAVLLALGFIELKV